jgi:hypothetical protein
MLVCGYGEVRRVRFRLQVAVKVDDSDGSVFSVDGTKKRECDGVVSSESDQTGECFASLRGTGFVGMGVWWAAQQ